MMPISSSAPPIETRTLTFFACAAAARARTSASGAPMLQSLVPELTVPKAKSRCVILLKSILVAQPEKLPLQFGRYITTLVSGVTTPPSGVTTPPSPADASASAPASLLAPLGPVATPLSSAALVPLAARLPDVLGTPLSPTALPLLPTTVVP